MTNQPLRPDERIVLHYTIGRTWATCPTRFSTWAHAEHQERREKDLGAGDTRFEVVTVK